MPHLGAALAAEGMPAANLTTCHSLSSGLFKFEIGVRRKLPKRSDEPDLILWFDVEPVVVFDLMSNVNSESAGHTPPPSDSGDFTPRNLSFLPKLVKEKTLGTQFP